MLLSSRRQALPDYIQISTDVGPIRIFLRANPRAKRYFLRIPAHQSSPVLTIPAGGSLANARSFAIKHSRWLVNRLSERPERVSFNLGDIFPLRGEDHTVLKTGKLRGLVKLGTTENGSPAIYVPGEEAHIPRKTISWLKKQAQKDLFERAESHAAKIGKEIKSISIRDTKSRWGSCSSEGRLSFSWRLILAPPEILDYVAAHEVAHLQEMNHSDRFWKLCAQLAPNTPTARVWLKENGHILHGFG